MHCVDFAMPCHRRCITLSGSILTAVGVSCLMLRVLRISRIPAVQDSTLLALSMVCRGLTSLAMVWCSAVTDEGVGAVVAANNGLLELELEGCFELVRPQLFFTAWPLYWSVSALAFPVRMFDKFYPVVLLQTDATLVAVADNCPQMHTLNIRMCQNLTKAGILTAVAATRITTLHASGVMCESATSELAARIRGVRPQARLSY